MRAVASVLAALPIAVATTVVWMVAADGQNLLVALLGLVGSTSISIVIVRGVRGHVQPLPAGGDPFGAPPGSGSEGTLPRWAASPGRVAHLAYAWNLAVFLGIDLFFLDGDVTATGLVWVLMLVAVLAHVAQAVFLHSLAQWMRP